MRRMSASHIGATLLAAITGAAIGISATTYGWWPVFAVLTASALGAITARALYRANRKHAQINKEELDPDPFRMRARPVRRTDTTGDNR